MKVYRVRSGDPQVAVSCLGGCGLMIAWLAVGSVNVSLMRQFQIPGWVTITIAIFWLLSFPVGAVAWLKWRGRRHSRAFESLEGRMMKKVKARIRDHSPEA